MRHKEWRVCCVFFPLAACQSKLTPKRDHLLLLTPTHLQLNSYKQRYRQEERSRLLVRLVRTVETADSTA